MGRVVLKIAIALGILLVISIIVSVWMVWKRPLKVDAMFSRFALGRLGFEKTSIATPEGHMTVWEAGSGPCMVLLHGAGDQAGAWARVVRPLLDDYHVVIPDLPGHWKSDPRSGPLSVGEILRGVEIVMESRCPGEKAVLVGNSLGAWVAFLYAHDYPGSVERVIAVNGGPLKEENPAVNLFPANREQAAATMKGLMGPATPPIPGFVLDDVVRQAKTGPVARLAQTADEMGAYLLDGRLDEVTVPVELVWGDADQLFTLAYAQRLLDGLPQARLYVVKGCGHVPQRECPDRFVAALEEALAAPPETPATTQEGAEE